MSVFCLLADAEQSLLLVSMSKTFFYLYLELFYFLF